MIALEHVVLWYFRKRTGEKFTVFLLLLILANNVHRVTTTYLQLKFYDPADEIKRTIIIKQNLEYAKQKALYSSMFLLPSLSYFAVLLAGFVTTVLLISLGFIGLNNHQLIVTIVELPAYSVGCLAIFYILQKRELKSFIRERSAVTK